jgi:hypothetical protein
MGGRTIDSFSASSAAVNNRLSGPKPGTDKDAIVPQQAERMGVLQNGSAARFDDLGLHLLPTMALKDFTRVAMDTRYSRTPMCSAAGLKASA